MSRISIDTTKSENIKTKVLGNEKVESKTQKSPKEAKGLSDLHRREES